MTTSFHSAMGRYTFAADGAVLSFDALRHNGESVGSGARKELLERSKAGEHIEIEFDAVTYIQRDTPNRNFLRFRKGLLRKLARSGEGSVFLKDHAQRDLLARGGTIVKSNHEKDDDGNDVFIQTIRLKKDWAVQGALDGTIDRFSIGWSPTGPVTYRHSGEELERWPKHWPGEKLEDGTAVEWVFMDAELIETSGVNVPAVLGTQIEGIREALTLALGESPGNEPSALEIQRGMSPHGETQMNGIKKILGLSDSAGEQEATAAIGKLQTELSVEKEKAASAEVELSQLQVKFEVLSAAQVDHEITAALADGRLKTDHDDAGNRVPSKLETVLRGQAEKFGSDVLRESLSSLPKMFGPPAVTQSQGTDATQDPPHVGTDRVDEALTTNPHLRKTMSQLGLSEEDLRTHGQINTLPDLH